MARARSSAKTGRPKLPAAQRKRHIIRFRANDQLLASLKAAADETDRSISEEIEDRLEQSFNDDEEWGGAHNKALLRMLQVIISAAEAEHGKRWLDDEFVLRTVLHLINEGIGHIRPVYRDNKTIDLAKSDVEIGDLVRLLLNAFGAPLRSIIKQEEP
jgi:hypothetical protein